MPRWAVATAELEARRWAMGSGGTEAGGKVQSTEGEGEVGAETELGGSS